MFPGQSAVDADFGLDVREDAFQTVIRIGDNLVLVELQLYCLRFGFFHGRVTS